MKMRVRNYKGFTLIELTIGILLSSILIGVIGFSFIVILRQFSNSYIRTSLRQDAAISVERLTKELSEAREITSSQTSSVSFWWQDNDGDGLRDATEVVTFSWDGVKGSCLERDSATLAFNVEGFQISYRDLNNSLLSPSPDLSIVERDSIRRVDVHLKLSRGDEEITLVSSILPRNLRQVRGPW